MKKAVLDSSFILTCVKQKIDFFEEIKLMGMGILIPKQVINEIKKISESGKKLHFKEDARIALKILEKNNFEKIDMHTKEVDRGMINLAKENSDLVIATLDREIKKFFKGENRILVIRGRKKMEIV